jgi:hypothetical protein
LPYARAIAVDHMAIAKLGRIFWRLRVPALVVQDRAGHGIPALTFDEV